MKRRAKPGWNDLDTQETGLTTRLQTEQKIMIDELERATKELDEKVGMRGSLATVRAGGVVVGPGLGVMAYDGGTRKSTIEPDGDVFFGSDISVPEGVSFAVFVNAQTYNAEDMEAGDLLIGNNSDDVPNVKYNALEGRLEFRIGTTVNIYTDTEGALTIANNVTGLSFASTDPDLSMYIKADNLDRFYIRNTVDGKPIVLSVDGTDGNNIDLTWAEDGANANVGQLTVGLGAAGGKLTIGSDVVIWARKDGTETVFNDGSFDINHRIESATNTHAFYMDAGAEYISFFGSTPTTSILAVDGGTDKRVEIGADHYFATRGGANPNTYINEANQDMDTYIRSVNDDNMFVVDAGLDAIGIGGAAESGYKQKVTGSAKVTDGFFWDGWDKRAEAWTRTGNHTFTVSGNLTTTYRKGTKVRYKDGGSYEYGVIGSSSHAAGTTTINLIPNSDYAMANATITDKYISYVENPEGFPHWFNFASTPGGFNPAALPTFTMTWTTIGNTIFVNLNALANGTSNSTAHNYSLPVASIAPNFQSTGLGVDNNNNVAITSFINAGATTLDMFVSPLVVWTNTGNKSANASLFYRF